VIADRFFETLETAPRVPSRAAATEMTLEFALSDAEGVEK